MSKQLLFSLTKKDFIIQFTRGTGKGGQKRNKVETAVRIIHPDSGAVGYSEDERSQLQNKKIAFERLVNNETFKRWHKIAIAKHLGTYDAMVEQKVNEMMNERNIKVEYYSAE